MVTIPNGMSRNVRQRRLGDYYEEDDHWSRGGPRSHPSPADWDGGVGSYWWLARIMHKRGRAKSMG